MNFRMCTVVYANDAKEARYVGAGFMYGKDISIFHRWKVQNLVVQRFVIQSKWL